MTRYRILLARGPVLLTFRTPWDSGKPWVLWECSRGYVAFLGLELTIFS
jgi:hypothetical protein